MAVSEIIGAAVGVLLLIIVAYVVVGSTLFAAETVTAAQKDLTLQQEARIRTSFSITDQVNSSGMIITNITNTGTETIGDFKHMDVIVYDNELNDYRIYPYSVDAVTPSRWGITAQYSTFIHPYMLDPGEKFQIRINTEGNSPKWFQITTANGIYASAFV
jgi:archaeal flagellar protein FlaF